MQNLKSTNDVNNLLECLDGNFGDESANQAEAADVIRELLAEVERQQSELALASREPTAENHAPECQCCYVMDPVVYTAQCDRCRAIQDQRQDIL